MLRLLGPASSCWLSRQSISFVSHFEKKKPRVPVLDHELVDYRVRRGAPDKRDYEVKLVFHHLN